MEADNIIKKRIDTVLPLLNERQRRIYLAAEAQSIGWGWKSKIAELASVTRRTVAKGDCIFFDNDDIVNNGRIRKEGGGRKKMAVQQPEMVQAIEDIVSPHTMRQPNESFDMDK